MLESNHENSPIILDGGVEIKDETQSTANTPFTDSLSSRYPLASSPSGHAVGLPDGQMGNSKVTGTLVGKVVWQDLPRISQAIEKQVTSISTAGWI